MVKSLKGWKGDIGGDSHRQQAVIKLAEQISESLLPQLSPSRMSGEVWLAPRSGAANRLDKEQARNSMVAWSSIKSKMGDY